MADGMATSMLADVITKVADGIATYLMADVIATCGRWNGHIFFDIKITSYVFICIM